MAEFLNQPQPRCHHLEPNAGFAAMGQPVPIFRKQAGYQTCRQIGLDTEAAWSAVNGMAEKLERDDPYGAMQAGMVWLDLTGTYRLMAVLLATPAPTGRALDIP